MDQHSHRPRKVGSSRRSIHNDFFFQKKKMRWRLRKMQQLRNSAPQASTTDAFGNSSESAFNDFVMGWCSSSRSTFRTSWWVDAWKSKNNVMGSLQRMKIWKFGWKTGRTDELQCLPSCSSCARLCPGLPGSLVTSWFPLFSPLCLLWIRGFQRFEFVNLFQQQPVFCHQFLHDLSGPMYYTLSLTVFKCTTCQQSKPHQRNRFFSRGHDPCTHACKAQASIDRCSTSLNVIVIVIVKNVKRVKIVSLVKDSETM